MPPKKLPTVMTIAHLMESELSEQIADDKGQQARRRDVMPDLDLAASLNWRVERREDNVAGSVCHCVLL